MPTNLDTPLAPPNDGRRMSRAELLGSHTHITLNGTRVHVWRRGDSFLVRGRYRGEAFGETLGRAPLEATARMRQIMGDIEAGCYVRPSEACSRQVADGHAARRTFRQLVDEFLVEKRTTRGARTASDYRARLSPLLAFAELPANRSRWPLASDVDRDFLVAVRTHLHVWRTTRNGKPGGRPRPLSARQVVNVMECLRSLLTWASCPATRRLPAGWMNPLTPELVGSVPAKDPLRRDVLTAGDVIPAVGRMDVWQLCHLAPLAVLPMRPDEAAGLLVSDADLGEGVLEFGARFADVNFTKGRRAFTLPLPEELKPLLARCAGGRAEGPLLRSRKAFAGGTGGVGSSAELRASFDGRLLAAGRGRVRSDNDRKAVFRSVLRGLGGVGKDALNREFKGLLESAGWLGGRTVYALRSMATTAMNRAGLPHLELRYLTGHTTADILNEYSALDIRKAAATYFASIEPLLGAIRERSRALGVA